MRTKNSFLNMLTNLIPSLIIPVISMVKLSWLMKAYGMDIYGMNLYLTQVMGYLNLVEGGFGFAFVQALFKPFAEGDKNKVRELYQGANFILKLIGCAIMGLGVLVFILLPWLLKTELNYSFVRIVFVLMIIPTVVDYFLMAPGLVMQADQKEYFLNLIRKSIQIIRACTHLVIIYNNMNYLFIPLTEGIYIIIQVFLSRIMVFKYYPWLKEKAKKDLSTLSNAKQVFAHRLAGVVLTSTDTLLLGKIIGTGANALYGNYNYITSEIQKILESIINAPKSSLGNLFASEGEKGYSVFKEFFSFTTFISTIVCIPVCITINRFVHFWQGDHLLLSMLDAFLFAGILFFVLSRQPIMLVRDTNGLFKESKKFAYMEAALNFSLSIIGIYFLGITGALLVTFFTYLASDLLMNSILVYKTVFKKDILEYYKMYLSKLFIALTIGVLSFVGWQYMISITTNLAMWFIAAGFLFIIESAVVFGIYIFLFEDFRLFLNRIRNIIRKRAS